MQFNKKNILMAASLTLALVTSASYADNNPVTITCPLAKTISVIGGEISTVDNGSTWVLSPLNGIIKVSGGSDENKQYVQNSYLYINSATRPTLADFQNALTESGGIYFAGLSANGGQINCQYQGNGVSQSTVYLKIEKSSLTCSMPSGYSVTCVGK